MAEEIVENASEWRTCFKDLHCKLGIRRPELYDKLGQQLRDLWGVAPEMKAYPDGVRGAVVTALEGMLKQIKIGRRKGFNAAVRVGYHIDDVPEPYEKTADDRLTWFAQQPKRIAYSTAQKHLALAVGEFASIIEAQLKAAGIIPSNDATPEPPDEPPAPTEDEQEQAPQTQTSPEPPTASKDSPKVEPPEDSLWTPEPEPLPIDLLSTFISEWATMGDKYGGVLAPETPVDIYSDEHWSNPEDDALALLALSHGKILGVRWAGMVLFGEWDEAARDIAYKGPRYNKAVRLASQRGINKKQMHAARILCAERGSLAIKAGDLQVLMLGLADKMYRQFTFDFGRTASASERAVANDYQRISLEKGGRLDLAGDWMSERVLEHGVDLAHRTGTRLGVVGSMQIATLYDGLRRATLPQLIAIHPIVLTYLTPVAQMLFHFGTPSERLDMATWILELATCTNRSTARGDSQRYITEVLAGLHEFGVSTTRDRNALANELAAAVGQVSDKPDSHGADLIAQSRL